MRITIQASDASCTYRVPVMKVQNYTLDEIFEKNLLFLIPFHIFSYEKNFSEYESNEKKLHELQKVYDEIITKLKEVANQHLIDEFTRSSILDMSKKVLEHIARKYANIKKGLGDIMGGKILDYPAKDILNKGRAEGRVEGRSEGMKEMAKNLKSLGVDVKTIMQASGLTEEQIERL